jgi:hypothetical protein
MSFNLAQLALTNPGRLIVPLPRPKPAAPSYVMQHGACFGPGCDPATDIPCGFTSLGSLVTYFELGAPGANTWDYTGVYSMPWTTTATGVVVAASGITDIKRNVIYFASMYFTVAGASQAWYSLDQLGANVMPGVGPLVSNSVCSEYGLSYVAINPFASPWPSAAQYYTWGATVFNPTSWGLTQL